MFPTRHNERLERSCDFRADRPGNELYAGGRANAAYNDAGPNPSYTTATLLNSSGLQSTTTTFLDGVGHVVRTQLTSDPDGTDTVDTVYDGLGRVYSVSNPYRATSDPTYGVTINNYDALNRITLRQNPDGSVKTWSYSGASVLARDEASSELLSNYDSFGRLMSVLESATPNIAPTIETDYGYDAAGNLLKVIQWGGPSGTAGPRIRAFAYDSASRLLAGNNPENATAQSPASLTCAGASGLWTACYSYDGNGNLTSKIDNRKVTTTYCPYDALNRVTCKSYSDGTAKVIYTYDAGVPNARGRLTQVANSASTTFYTGYDSMGRISSSIQELAGYNYPFSYTYNLAGSLTSEIYPSGRILSSTFNGANRAVAISGTLNAVVSNYVAGVKYAPHGALALYAYGNNLWRTQNYNYRLQMASFWDAIGNTPSNFLFIENPLNWGTTNNNGNLLGITSYAGGPAPASSLKQFNQAFTYDGMNRLQTAADNGGWTRSFNYDAFGNMWATGTGIAPTTTPSSNIYNGNNQLGGVAYGAAGNQLVVNGNTLAYDAENRLRQSTDGVTKATETYVYDGDGKRVFRASSSGVLDVYVYDALGSLAAEYSSASQPSPCATCYLSWDHLGSTRLVTDASGSVVSRHDYLPFEEEIQANQAGRNSSWGPGNDSVAQKFTGKERDPESGLDYFGARYYGSALGRWTTPDEIFADQHLEDPQSWNLYAYVRNSPLTNFDSNGRTTLSVSLGGQQSIDIEQTFRDFSTRLASSASGFGKQFINELKSGYNRASEIVSDISGGGINIGQVNLVSVSPAEQAGGEALSNAVIIGVGVFGFGAGNGESLPDSAFVVRGGTNTPEAFAKGAGVTVDASGSVQGVSVDSAGGKSVTELSEGIPHNKIGVTTVGAVRGSGGRCETFSN